MKKTIGLVFAIFSTFAQAACVLERAVACELADSELGSLLKNISTQDEGVQFKSFSWRKVNILPQAGL